MSNVFSDTPAYDVRCMLACLKDLLDAAQEPPGCITELSISRQGAEGLRIILDACYVALEPLTGVGVPDCRRR